MSPLPATPSSSARLCGVLLALAALLHGPEHAAAAIFARVPRSLSSTLEKLGGRASQESGVVLNGQPGRMRVFGFSQTPRDLSRELAVALDRPDLAQAVTKGGLWLEWPEAGDPASHLLLLPGEQGRSVGIVLELASEASRSEPSWPWPDLPVPPEFQARFTAVRLEGDVGLVSGNMPTPPDQTRLRLHAHLQSQGWICATPAAEALSTSLYAKDRELLVATTIPPPDGVAGTRVALLRRKPQ